MIDGHLMFTLFIKNKLVFISLVVKMILCKRLLNVVTSQVQKQFMLQGKEDKLLEKEDQKPLDQVRIIFSLAQPVRAELK